MLALEDYVELKPSIALRQWREVLSRTASQSGLPYLPIETLLVLAAMRIVDRSKYGSSNRAQMPTPTPELAELLGRSLGSIHAKMSNLHGSMSNGGKQDPAVYRHFSETPGELDEIYLVVLGTARLAGINASQLPDFLHLAGQAE